MPSARQPFTCCSSRLTGARRAVCDTTTRSTQPRPYVSARDPRGGGGWWNRARRLRLRLPADGCTGGAWVAAKDRGSVVPFSIAAGHGAFFLVHRIVHRSVNANPLLFVNPKTRVWNVPATDDEVVNGERSRASAPECPSTDSQPDQWQEPDVGSLPAAIPTSTTAAVAAASVDWTSLVCILEVHVTDSFTYDG